jgi:hypothetical protein
MVQTKPVTRGAIVKNFLRIMFAVMVTTSVATAKELPDAPSAEMSAIGAAEPIIVSTASPDIPPVTEKSVMDKKFIALAIITAGSTFADSYTTMFASQNWKAGKTNVCNAEGQSPYLYGTHPTATRAYGVAFAKTAGSIVAARYLRKHHNRFWALPLIGISATSLQGVTQNMNACN